MFLYEVAHRDLSPRLSAGGPPGTWLNKHQPWWLPPSFQDGCLISHTAGPYTAVAQPPPFCLLGNDGDKSNL